MNQIRVSASGYEKVFEYEPRKSLLEILRSNGFSISAPCGGRGTCGNCKVLTEEYGQVRSCSFYPEGELHVLLGTKSFRIEKEIELGKVLSDAEDGLGVCMDIGTTTIVCKLADLKRTEILGGEDAENCLTAYGGDVISRISYICDNENGLQLLSSSLRSQVEGMIFSVLEKCGKSVAELRRIVISGNTVMQHIFAGLDPESIARYPFIPETLFGENDAPADSICGAEIFYSPCVSSYVGGDIVSGAIAADLMSMDGLNLFIDVGTNGEIVIGGKDKLICCSTACGPAFEGAGLSCGMSARDGAISKVWEEDDELCFEVIGGGEAKGICGSAAIDLLALLADYGIADDSGYMEEDFYITDKVFLSRADVRNLQLAKAAVSCGIYVLMKQLGIEMKDINSCLLAGGFGAHLDVKNAARIGLISGEMAEKCVYLGNTSLKGAAMQMLSSKSREAAFNIQNRFDYIELSQSEEFNTYYPDFMSLNKEELPWK